MLVKIRQRFHVTDGIEVEDGQRSMGEREREEVNNDKEMSTEVADGG
jgi:hypothetical protein